jgi:hypothetical protein
MASAARVFGNSWQTQPRTILSTTRNGTRLGLPRRSTMICCRNTRISASKSARDRNRSTTIPKIILQRSNIPQKIIRFCVCRQLHGIYDRDSGLALRLCLGHRDLHRRHPPKPHLSEEAGGAAEAQPAPELATVPLCLREEASPFWIILLLVEGDPEHPRIKLAAPGLPRRRRPMSAFGGKADMARTWRNVR